MISRVQGQQGGLPSAFISIFLLGQPCPLVYILSRGNFPLYRQSYTVETEVVWLAKLEIFGSFPSSLKKNCQQLGKYFQIQE